MLKLLLKIAGTQKNIVPVRTLDQQQLEVKALGLKIQEHIKRLFQGSLAIRQVDAGSDNACEQELVALSNNFYDVERFGIHFVASPRHADMLLITGPVTRNMAKAALSAYNATPDPKMIVAVGDDAITGGIYKGSYAIAGPVDTILPVDYHIPGDPPSPMTILQHLLCILETREPKS
jgi:Ni,Fe-hydrogenase III small subunit